MVFIKIYIKTGIAFDILKSKQEIMKQLLLFLALSTTFLFSSCEGDPGPPGPPGDDFLAQTFEFENVNFQYNIQDNRYFTDYFSFPQNVEVFESDAVLVYRYEETVDIGNGDTADVWTQLPQSVFYNDNTGDVYQYNFNHTFVDIQFTIEGNFDLTNIGVNPDPTVNQIFRVVIVPSAYADARMTMDEAIETFNIQL